MAFDLIQPFPYLPSLKKLLYIKFIFYAPSIRNLRVFKCYTVKLQDLVLLYDTQDVTDVIEIYYIVFYDDHYNYNYEQLLKCMQIILPTILFQNLQSFKSILIKSNLL